MKTLTEKLIESIVESNSAKKLTPVKRDVSVFQIDYRLWRFFGGSRTGSWEPMTLRELWTENYNYIFFYRNSSETSSFKKENCSKCGSTYIVKDIDEFCKAMRMYAIQRKADDASYTYKETGKKTIEVAKEDESYWRFKGESNWRKLPDV